MSSEDREGDINKDTMNTDNNNHGVDTNKQQNEDNNNEGENEKDHQADVELGEGSASPKESSLLPAVQTSAAVDMTGSIKSPISSATSTLRAKSDDKSRDSKLNEADKSLNKLRFGYPGKRHDEWESEMDVSRRSNMDEDTMSKELTVEQIHDQRAKLAAQNPPRSTEQATSAPPRTHQLSSSAEKPTGQKSSGSSIIVPGAYYSVDTMDTNEHRNSTTTMENETEASAVMQLEAVPVDESLEQAEIKEMKEQLNLEKQRRLSLERRMQEKEREATISRNHRNCTKERFPIVMAFLILLSGIAVGLYFLLAPNEMQDVESSEKPFFIYPPPTTEECEAVLRGAEVPNQDKYSTLEMGLTLDISYDGVVDSIDALQFEILERYESNVVPTLVGCNDDGFKKEETALTYNEDRYLVANAQVLNVTRSTSDCNAAEPVPCVRITINHLFWLKEEISLMEMIGFVQKNFGPTLLQGLVEGGIVRQTKLVSLGPLQHEETDLPYPPPTAEECEAILRGDAVPNQDQYPTVVIDATIDISVYDSWEDSIDMVLFEFQKQLVSSMVPIVVGCTTIGQAIYDRNPTENEYIFANIKVMDVTKSSSECHIGVPRPCVQVESRFFVWLKRELEAFDAISFVHNNFQDILMKSISESDIIHQVTLVSAGPTPVQFEFPPPTEEECEAVINGDPIPGQDEYFTQRTNTVIDVSTHEPWEDSLDTVLLTVRDTWQTLIIPTLAGCMDKVDETWFNSTKTPERYVAVNSIVLNVTHIPGECNDARPRPCLKVGIRTRMWLEKEMNFVEIISAVDENYGPALMAKIGNREDKSAIIKQAEIVMMVPVA